MLILHFALILSVYRLATWLKQGSRPTGMYYMYVSLDVYGTMDGVLTTTMCIAARSRRLFETCVPDILVMQQINGQ